MRTPKDFDRPGPPTLHPAGFSPSKQRLPGRRAPPGYIATVSQVFGCPVLSSFVQPTPGTQNAPEIKPAGHQGVTVGDHQTEFILLIILG